MTDKAVTVKSVENQKDSSVSLSQHFATVLAEHGSLVAQVQEVDGRLESRTFSDLLLQGKRVARFLREKGLKSGDIVFFSNGNNLASTPIMLGTLFIGAALAPVYRLNGTVEMLHFLTEIRPTLAICNPQSISAVTEAISQSDTPVPLVALETVQLAMEDAGKDSEEFQLEPVEDPGSHVAFLLSTSGTSGKPKSIEHVHRSFVLMEDYPIYRPSDEPLDEQGVYLNCSFPHWCLTQMANVVFLSKGIKQVLLDQFTPERFLAAVTKFKVNYAILIPPHLATLVHCPDLELSGTSSLTSVVYSGCGMSPVLIEQVEKKLGVPIAQFYGTTETNHVTSPPYDVTDKPGTAGRLCPGFEIKVLDLNTGKPLDANTEGELWVRGPWLMKGYHNKPEATAAIVDTDGFLCTGDVGYIDQDGFLFVCDRIKDLIWYKYLRVDVRGIEDVLLGHPDVQEVAIVGILHEKDFEHATGFVVRRQGSEVTARQLEELVEAQLRAQDWLYGGVWFVDSIPKTATGKVQKRLLREMISSPAGHT